MSEAILTAPIHIPMRFESEPLLWCIENAYSPAECNQLIQLIERSAPALATNNPVYRDQDRVILDDRARAADLFRRLESRLPRQMGSLRLVGLNDRLRFYRYRVGQRFQPHMDHWYQPNDHQITLHTVLIYLNDTFTGGETAFYEQLEQVVKPRTGMAAIFQHKVRHEGKPILSGTKYALRSDVIYEAESTIASVGEEC
jgi:hypothetical protein